MSEVEIEVKPWPPIGAEYLLSSRIYGEPVAAGSKTGRPHRSKNTYGKWRLRSYLDAQGNESVKVFVVDNNEKRLARRAREVAEQIVEDMRREAFGMPTPRTPIAMQVTFLEPRAKRHYGTGSNENTLRADAPSRPTKAPDTTKLWRALEDSFTEILWDDDRDVTDSYIAKDYLPRGAEPCVELIMWALPVTQLQEDDARGEGQVSLLP